jgi:hypothetical protein
MLQSASYYKRSADPGCHRHKSKNQDSSAKEEQLVGAAWGFAFLHHHHAGFSGKGIQPSAILFRDLHGCIF